MGKHRKRFAIIGCGTAGLAAAIPLARAGHDVFVFERFSEPAAIGAGILVQPSGAAVLQAFGLLDELERTAARIDALDGRLASGKRIMDVLYRHHAADARGLGVHRANLLAMLHEAAQDAGAGIHCASEVEAIERGPSNAILRFADGRKSEPFDAVVIANGTQSRLREQLPIRQFCKPYPWGALWAIFPSEDGDPLPHALVQRYHRASVMIGLMPTGFRARISSAVIVCGTISEYTFASRTRRAMSWAYWAPKSTTRTGRGVVVGPAGISGAVAGDVTGSSYPPAPPPRHATVAAGRRETFTIPDVSGTSGQAVPYRCANAPSLASASVCTRFSRTNDITGTTPANTMVARRPKPQRILAHRSSTVTR
jgi:glycine/D-amino acid oxidase-like deaminating enzyme